MDLNTCKDFNVVLTICMVYYSYTIKMLFLNFTAKSSETFLVGTSIPNLSNRYKINEAFKMHFWNNANRV